MAGYGRLLREARQQRGFSLEEAEAATKIRLLYLTALEAEDTIALPEPVYARGFLRTYARFLNLDPERLLALYPLAPVSDMPPPPPRLPSREIPGSALLGLALVLLLIASLIIYLSQRGEGSQTQGVGVTIEIPSPAPSSAPPAGATTTTTVVTATVSPARPSPSPTGTTTPTPTPTDTPAAKVSLPNLIGVAYAQAAARLTDLELSPTKIEEWNADVTKGLVYRQEPAPGQSLATGSEVRLWVSRGPQLVTVPDVVFKTEAEARQILIAAGLNPSPYANRQRLGDLPIPDQQRLASACTGCVLSTTPPGGAQVPPGTVVDIAVRA